MRRRAFITLMGGATISWPLVAYAQHPAEPLVCGWMGVKVSPMTAAFADSLGMTEPYGAIFDRPQPGSPAANAGIEAGDAVTAINGTPLASWRDFATTISMMAPDTTVFLNTWRSGQPIEVRVVLGSSKCPAKAHRSRIS